MLINELISSIKYINTMKSIILLMFNFEQKNKVKILMYIKNMVKLEDLANVIEPKKNYNDLLQKIVGTYERYSNNHSNHSNISNSGIICKYVNEIIKLIIKSIDSSSSNCNMDYNDFCFIF